MNACWYILTIYNNDGRYNRSNNNNKKQSLNNCVIVEQYFLMIQKWLWVFWRVCLCVFILTHSQCLCVDRPDSHMIFFLFYAFPLNFVLCVQKPMFLFSIFIELNSRLHSQNDKRKIKRARAHATVDHGKQRCIACHRAYHIFIFIESIPILFSWRVWGFWLLRLAERERKLNKTNCLSVDTYWNGCRKIRIVIRPHTKLNSIKLSNKENFICSI